MLNRKGILINKYNYIKNLNKMEKKYRIFE